MLKSLRRIMSNSFSSKVGNNVYVQRTTDKNMLTISFSYGESKQFNLYRKIQEPLSLSLERIRLNLKKLKESDYKVEMIFSGSKLDPSIVSNGDAWIEGAVLKVNDQVYEVQTNYPGVETLNLPSCIMRGYVIMPIVSLHNCSIEDCEFIWYRKLSSHERNKLIEEDGANTDRIVAEGNLYWLKLSDGLIYYPTDDDVAHHIKITCRPVNCTKVGKEVHSISNTPVEVGPTECPFEKRHSLTKNPTCGPHELRFVTYNILADLYADSDYSRSVLFAHCPSHALIIDYRRQLLLKEILGYNADIICLQELDKKEFRRTYLPVLKTVGGLQGIYDTKGGQVAEGLGTFFRQSRYELVHSHRTILSELIEENCVSPDDMGHFILKNRKSQESIELLSKFDEIRACMSTNEALKKRFMERHTVLQTTLLKSKELDNSFIVVANTHLYFAPDADHVRLLQGSVCVKYLEFIKPYYKSLLKLKYDVSEPDISLIFCGDMNSTPDCGLYKLLTEGKVTSDLPDWSSNIEETVVGLNIETHLRFSSAYLNLPYTNYTPGFNGCLDYIYYEKNSLQCDSTVPLPDHKDVTAIDGLPSDVFPSDHLALIGNLRLTA